MGIIAKQGLKNVYSTYLGFLIGGIYTALLVPKAFNENLEYWGLMRLFLSYAMIVIPWVQLSIPNIILRFFPIQSKKENGAMISSMLFWLLLSLIITFIGVFIAPHFLFNDDVLIKNNFLYLFPIILGYILFEVLSALSKSMLKSTLPVFLKEFVYRFYILILVLLYWFNYIEFQLFIFLFSIAYLIVLIPLLFSVIAHKDFKINIKDAIKTTPKSREYLKYGFFIMLSGGAGIFMLNIDNVMINEYLSLSDITIYTTWYFLASFLNIPSRSITAVATPIISKGINDGNISQIQEVYTKSSLIPFAFSLLIFLAIYLNIDLISFYLGDKFSHASWVFIIIGIGNLVNIASGINGTIISLSKHFKFDLYFQLAMIIIIIITNIIFIPYFGINGAAFATAISVAFINSLRLVFVYKKFKIHPFSIELFYLILIGALMAVGVYFLKENNNFLMNILYSCTLAISYTVLIYKLHISTEINEIISKYISFILRKTNK